MFKIISPTQRATNVLAQPERKITRHKEWRYLLAQPWQLVTDLAGLARVLRPDQTLHYYGLFLSHLPQVIRSRSLGPIDRLIGEGPFVARCEAGKAKLQGPQMAGAIREIWARRVYLGNNFLSIAPDSLVVDLGANAGDFTLFAATFAHKGQVIAVEAQGHLVELLKRNLKLNDATGRVKIAHGVVGANSGVITAMRDNADVPDQNYSVADLLALSGRSSIDFLKIDIEGSEFDLFASEPEFLAYTKQLAIEIHLDFGRLETIQKLCERYGFSCRVTKLGSSNMRILYARR